MNQLDAKFGGMLFIFVGIGLDRLGDDGTPDVW